MSMGKVHDLKIQSKYFKNVAYKIKQFELRKNDRDYKAGDTLILNEIDENNKYTNKKVIVDVDYILNSDDCDGLLKGYCILGITAVKLLANIY